LHRGADDDAGVVPAYAPGRCPGVRFPRVGRPVGSPPPGVSPSRDTSPRRALQPPEQVLDADLQERVSVVVDVLAGLGAVLRIQFPEEGLELAAGARRVAPGERSGGRVELRLEAATATHASIRSRTAGPGRGGRSD